MVVALTNCFCSSDEDELTDDEDDDVVKMRALAISLDRLGSEGNTYLGFDVIKMSSHDVSNA
jgi:hypothetical protein